MESKLYVCRSFILYKQRGQWATLPSFVAETWELRRPAHFWKRSLQRSECKGDENRGTLPMTNKYLLADLLVFMRGEGDEAKSPSCATRCTLIEASSALLEVLIAAS